MAPSLIRLKVDAAPLQSALDALSVALESGSLELEGDLALQLRELFVDGSLDGGELIRIDSHRPADGTGDFLLSLEPSDLFLQLLAALGAGDRDDL